MTPDEQSQPPLPPPIKRLIQESNRRGFTLIREALARDDRATLYTGGVTDDAMELFRSLSAAAVARIIETPAQALCGLVPLLLMTLLDLLKADGSDEEIERQMPALQARLVRERRRRHTPWKKRRAGPDGCRTQPRG